MSAKNRITTKIYESPAGPLLLGSLGDRLCLCDWLANKQDGHAGSRLRRRLGAEFADGISAVLEIAVLQLDEYVAGIRREFDIPLLFAGTDFQKKVWDALLTIPYGMTLSYGRLAQQIGMPKAVRAVANANGANSISIFVPCHRVIGRDLMLTGYGGGLEAKKYLLTLENAKFAQ